MYDTIDDSQKTIQFSGPFIPDQGVGFGEKWETTCFLLVFFFWKHDYAHMKTYFGRWVCGSYKSIGQSQIQSESFRELARDAKGFKIKRESTASFL